MHILSFHRRSVFNVQEDFTVLDQWTPTLGKCLELVLPRIVLKDTIALQVGYNSAAILTQTCNVFRSCYQIEYKYVSVKSDAADAVRLIYFHKVLHCMQMWMNSV